MASLARSMGISETAFTNLVTNVNTNEDCRIEWKYACSRKYLLTEFTFIFHLLCR